MNSVVKEADLLECLEELSKRLGLPSPTEEWQAYLDRQEQQQQQPRLHDDDVVPGPSSGPAETGGGIREAAGSQLNGCAAAQQPPPLDSSLPFSLMPLTSSSSPDDTAAATAAAAERAALAPGHGGGGPSPLPKGMPPASTLATTLTPAQPQSTTRPSSSLWCGPPWLPPGSVHALAPVEQGLREGCKCQVGG